MTLDEKKAALAAINAQVDSLKEQARGLVRAIDAEEAAAKIQAQVDALAPEVKAQVLKAVGIESAEAVGTPGA